MAHNTPQHTGRLIAKLRSPNSRFFVHIDRKADLSPFNYLRSHDTLFIAERESVYWADVSQIDAALKLVAAALESEPRMERFVLLSGADYPVRSRAEVEDYLLDNLTTEYMNLRRMPAPEVGKPISRLRNYRIPSGAAAWRVKLVKAGQRLDLIPREQSSRRYSETSCPSPDPNGGQLAAQLPRALICSAQDTRRFMHTIEIPRFLMSPTSTLC